MKVADLLTDSPYLCKEQLWDKVISVNIDRVEAGHNIPKQGTSKKDKRNVMFFKGAKKGLVLNITNTKFLIRTFGGKDTAEWQGRPVVLYVDKSNKNPDGTVGGIRLAVGDRYSGKNPPPRTATPPARGNNGKDWSEQPPSETAPSPGDYEQGNTPEEEAAQ